MPEPIGGCNVAKTKQIRDFLEGRNGIGSLVRDSGAHCRRARPNAASTLLVRGAGITELTSDLLLTRFGDAQPCNRPQIDVTKG